MKQPFAKVLFTAAICGTSIFFTSCVYAQNQTNVALHQKVTMEPRSNYSFTKNRDPQQLTDGVYASTNAKWDPVHQTSTLWVQEGCIGWQHKKPVIITIDLGKVQPISGLIYSTAGGKSGVTWPDDIYIATSDDNKTWHYAGELVALSQKNGAPPAEGYKNFRYITHDLKTHGRYVALGVMESPMIFVDEVEVLRGDDSLLNQSAGREIPEMKDFVAHETITSKARNRQNADIAAVRALIDQSHFSASQKSTFKARLDKDAAATKNMTPLPVDFKTIIPLTDVHRDILAVHGEALAAQGLKPLTVWKKHRYAWLPLIHHPQTGQPATLNFSMMKDQIRTDAVLLTNAGGKPVTVNIALQNAPSEVQQGWLQLDSAIWTDTYEGVPVQDALLPLENKKGVYSMKIPAGVTGKLWVTIDSSKIPAGKHKSTFVISNDAQKITVPLNVDISNIAMGTPRMSLGMWDYTNGNGYDGITPGNREAAIKLMRSHFVDSPWATSAALPFPKASDFDANNQLTGTLNFSNLDQWLAMWPGAHNYMIFRNVYKIDTFAGAKMGTPEFNARVGSWLKAIAAHVKTLGIEPSRLVICPVDEARSDQYNEYILGWGKAMKAAVPEIRLFSDPIWRDPAQAKHQEAFTLPDILSPHPNWANGYFVDIAHKNNQELWLYNGPGLHHTGDPQLAYRQMAWRVFAAGGKGEGFWTFNGISGAETSWNAYTATRPMYAPAFLDKDTVYDSIHWDAVRDGVEDFEELSMLQDAIKKSSNAALKTQAQKVLDDAVKTVNNNAGANDQYEWAQATDPAVVDAQLRKVREMLEKLGGENKVLKSF